MTADDSQPGGTAKTDPRLKSFLRQAQAIIAQEKGLNASCRVKLQALAGQLKLSKFIFEKALQQLQDSSDAEAHLNHYEKAFVRFLDNEFEKLHGGVLSPGMEKNAIDLANRKYLINNAKAEKFIQSRADEAGISRISPDEAILFAEQMIVDQVGVQSVVDEDMHLKLLKIGKKWGLEADDVEQIVLRQLKTNRRRTNRHPEKFAILMLLLAILLGVVWIAYAVGVFSSRPDTAQKESDKAESTSTETVSSWMSSGLRGNLKSLEELSPNLSGTTKRIEVGDNATRVVEYQQLVRSACQLSDDIAKKIRSALSQLFYEDPNEEAALSIISEITSIFNKFRENERRDSSKSIFRANQLFAQLYWSRPLLDNNVNQSDRWNSVEEAVCDGIGISIRQSNGLQEYLEISERALAIDLWNELARLATTSPGTASAKWDATVSATQDLLEPEPFAQYFDAVILSIIQTDVTRWRELRDPIVRSLQRCDEIKMADWTRIYLASNDDLFQELIGLTIVNRVNANPRSNRRVDITAAIASYSKQQRYLKFQPIIDRSDQIEQRYANLLTQDNSATLLPDRIAQMALAVNVEMAFIDVVESASLFEESAFLVFDRLIATPSPRLQELVSLPIDRRVKKSGATNSATASDVRRKDASLQRLSVLDADTTGLRILALKQLERVAHRFERISYEDAEILARYFFSPLSVQERLEVESRIESFSHWPNLAIAAADTLPQAELDFERAANMARLLTNQELSVLPSADWKQTLGMELIASTAADLSLQIDQDPNNINSNWNRLKLYLNDCYRQRQSILLNDDTDIDSYSTPSQATMKTVDRLIQIAARPSNQSLQRANSLIRQSDLNEIEKAVVANQLLIQFLTNESTSNGLVDDSDSTNASLQKSLKKSTSLGEQLFETERTIYVLMAAKRKNCVHRLLRGQ